MDEPFGRASTRSSWSPSIRPATGRPGRPRSRSSVRYVTLGRNRIAAAAGAPFAVRVPSDARAGPLDARRPQRLRATGHAPASGAAAEGPLHADGLRQRAHGACGRLRPGAVALTELARLAGPLGCSVLALLFVATRRELRLAGLVAWAVGLRGLGVYLAPDGRTGTLLVASAVAGSSPRPQAPGCCCGIPGCSPFATLACIPIRIPFDIGDENANLLLPLYAVIGALALALAWQLLRGDDRIRELGPLAWPLAAVVAGPGSRCSGRTTSARARSSSPPSCCRSGCWPSASPGCPSAAVLCSASSAPSSRPRSPMQASGSTSGRPERCSGTRSCGSTTPTRPSSASTRSSGTRRSTAATSSSRFSRRSRSSSSACGTGCSPRGIVAIAAIWVGLLFSFSQSSFAALIAGTLAAAAVIWRWRAAAASAVLAVVLVSAGFATPQVRHELLQESRQGLNSVTSDRAGLVGNGLRIAVDHPILGVGTGSFKRAYAEKTGLKGEEPKKAASHSTPVTVVAETGVLGLALLCWLGFVALATAFRSRGRSDAGRAALVAALTLGAIAVHSLFYNALFEDPTMWALLGLIALVSTYRPQEPSRRDRDLEARARARAAHRRRRVRLRRHDGTARRGRGGGALPRLLDRDAVAAGRVRARHARPRGTRGDRRARDPRGQLRVHDFDVRTFPERRQDILELLVGSGRS